MSLVSAKKELDSFGIQKLYPDGPFHMNAEFIKGRQDGTSNRWNVASDEPPGAIPSPKENIHYEVSLYTKVSKPFEGLNLKVWGPHHGSKGTKFKGSATPCCWYDIGIDSNGDVKPQIEFPHPENKDVPNPGPIKNIGSIVNKWVGVKWVVYKIADTKNRKVELWQDRGGLDSQNKPVNDWVQLLDKTDTGDWLDIDYSPPDQQEIELRVRDVDPNAIEIKYLYARDIVPFVSSSESPDMTTPIAATPAIITSEELKIIQAKRKAYEDALAAGSTNTAELAQQYFAAFINALIDNVSSTVPPVVPPGPVLPPPGPGPTPVGCGSNPDPNNEHVKEGGWGADTASPNTWQSVPMKDDPAQFKVTDAAGQNIAHKFASEAEADKYIQYYICMDEQGDTEPLPPPQAQYPQS